MFVRVLFLLSALVFPASAFSDTPGDAAYRAGHPEQAADLYRRGAEQGDSTAAYKLWLLVNRGAVSAEKFGISGKWFIKACELGDIVGCHNAGNGYEYGPAGKDGLEKDYVKARDFYQRAASKGYMPSQYNLGSLFANEYFQDDVEGLKWLLIAQQTARGCAKAPLCAWVLEEPPGHIAHMRKRMPDDAQASAEKLAADWKVEK